MEDANKTIRRTFTALVLRQIEFLRIAVVLDATKAKRTNPTVGVWRLDFDRFVRIAENIAQTDKRIRNNDKLAALMTVVEVAQLLDDQGVENRLFRFDGQVALWLDETEPEETVDFACT